MGWLERDTLAHLLEKIAWVYKSEALGSLEVAVRSEPWDQRLSQKNGYINGNFKELLE